MVVLKLKLNVCFLEVQNLNLNAATESKFTNLNNRNAHTASSGLTRWSLEKVIFQFSISRGKAREQKGQNGVL